MRLFQVIGRKAPTKTDENPSAYRMKIFAPNEVLARSRFWYFMHQMRKMKKTTGEILDVNEVSIWLWLKKVSHTLSCIYNFLIDYRKEYQLCQELRHLDQVQLSQWYP